MTESERYGLSLSAPRLESHLPLQYSRHPHKTTTVLTVLVSLNDASADLHYRSALRYTTDVFPLPFSYTLGTPTFARSTSKFFVTSTCMVIMQIASLNGHLCHIWRPACDLNGGQPRTH